MNQAAHMLPVILEAVVLVERRDGGKIERGELLLELALEKVYELPVSSVVLGGGVDDEFDTTVQDAEQRRVLGKEGGIADTSEALVFAEAATRAVGKGDDEFDVNSACDWVGVEEVIVSFVLELIHLLNPVINFDLVFHDHLGLIDVSYCVDLKKRD